MTSPYYEADLALVHHRGFGFHAAACAPGILDLLSPVRTDGGLVLELGCGSGLLTRELVAAGHRVLATDASPAMLDLARAHLRNPPRDAGAVDVAQLTLPDDPIPSADAIVAIGHPLNYLPDEVAIGKALDAMAASLRPGGVLAVDLCDLAWGEARRSLETMGRSGADWAIITHFSLPAPNRFVRDMVTFLPDDDADRVGCWRRSEEHHENVLVDTAGVPARLARFGVEASVVPSFGAEVLPAGLVCIVGRRPLATG